MLNPSNLRVSASVTPNFMHDITFINLKAKVLRPQVHFCHLPSSVQVVISANDVVNLSCLLTSYRRLAPFGSKNLTKQQRVEHIQKELIYI